MKHIKTLITIIAAALLIISIFTGAAAADNVTNSSTEQVNALDYSTDPTNVWYDYYKSIQDPNLETIIYYILMNSSSLSADAKQAAILSLVGCDYRFLTGMNYATYTYARLPNGDGTLTYNSRALDWWKNPVEEGDEFTLGFMGVSKEQLEILYYMCREEYNEYVQAEVNALYPILLENNYIMDFDEYVIESLPQTTAEVGAMYKVILENWGEYRKALRDVRNSTRNP